MGVSVLVVDDDEDILVLLKMWIEDAPGDLRIVGEARSPDDAVRLVADLRPDVVLLDARMPPGDGFAAAERIRQIRPDQAMVMYSGAVDDAVRERARAAGFSDCVAKDDYARLPAALVAAVVR